MKESKLSSADLISETKRNNLTSLNFTDIENKLYSIPEELYSLTQLETLNLGQIPIRSFSKKIENLDKLNELYIPNGKFENFPLELLKLKSLRHLVLANKKIKILPLELNDWKNLKYLLITDSPLLEKIQGIPPNLTYLNISQGAFGELPEIIFSLKKLTKLVIHGWGLEELPKGLFNLTSLIALFAGINKLQSIPKEISKCSKLKELVLYNNNFKEYPENINLLTELKTIDLRSNYINSIPSSITNLVSLESFRLNENNLTEFPLVIQSLKSLKEITFGKSYLFKERGLKNIIKNIPDWITELPHLETLSVDSELIENVPPEILKDGFAAVKNFILSKKEADHEVFLYEAKMVIVGRGNVGKSVLTKKLTIDNYTLSESESTKGIDILKHPFIFNIAHQGNKIDFKFNIWDFGGQEKYDATHQLFITNRSIYLFLTEAREESNYSDFQFWLNTIKLFSNNSPVIIVLSKSDERRKLLPESQYREKFKNIVDFVEVSCADGYEHTIVGLKKVIEKAINLLPQTEQKLSNHWVDIRNKLEKLSLDRDYINYNEYLDICKEHKLNHRQADFLSQYLNDLGVIIHHQHDLLLKKTVFINTDWCVDGMYMVLDDNKIFNTNGKFTINDLAILWREKRFESKQEELLKLLKEYNLCFELKDGTGFLAPDLLPPDRVENFDWDNKNNLFFEYRYDFMPSGLLSRFIVKSHSFIKDNLYWKYGVVLEYDETQGLIAEDYIHNKLKISLRGDNKKGLLSAIRMYIQEVHEDFNQSNQLEFEQMVPCNCAECKASTTPHFYKFTVLKKFEKKGIVSIICDESTKEVKVQSLINDIQIKSEIDYLETDEDLKNYILSLIDTVVVKEIYLKEGYMNFWRDSTFKVPKNETEIQPYISNILDHYCKVKGINLAREVREANGSVDILFSSTNKNLQVLKVCMEIKKAHHAKVETSIETQLPLYMKSSGTESGIYLVIWFKHDEFLLPRKFDNEKNLINAIEKNNPDKKNISTRIINCCKKTSPSKV